MNAHDCRKIFREKRKNGQIEVPSSCSKCNRDDLPIKPFFEDYDKPEQITWLCTECFKSFDKARPNPFKGKKHSLESRLSMSVSHEGIEIPEITRIKISKTMTGKSTILPLVKKIKYENGEIGLYKLYRRYQRRNKEFLLTLDEFKEITSKKCHYCGCDPSMMSYKNGKDQMYIHNGIDRINSTLGYMKDNVVPCCGLCNMMKFTYDTKTFLNHVMKIANYQSNLK